MVERLMMLDAVLTTDVHLAGDRNRQADVFVRKLDDSVSCDSVSRVTFGRARDPDDCHFPDKMPIGIQPDSHEHVFAYLVTRPDPMDFAGSRPSR
jgi:hypothetical protein